MPPLHPAPAQRKHMDPPAIATGMDQPEDMSPGDKHSPYNATEVPQFPLLSIKGRPLKFMFLKITSLCGVLPPQVAT